MDRSRYWRYYIILAEWVELNRYCEKLNVRRQWLENLTTIVFNNKPCNDNKLNKALFEYILSQKCIIACHEGIFKTQSNIYYKVFLQK